MPAPRWTEEQNLAIQAKGGGILVSAAAGSGKTAVLVERVVELLTRETDPVPADRLLIVTFTNAAAADMKQRILSALEEKIAADPDNSHYLDQQILLAHTHIGTISSFCADFIRRNFELLEIAPDYRIAEQAEVMLLEQQAADAVLEEYYAKGEPEFLRLADIFASRSDRLLSEQILRIYGFIRSHPFPLYWLDEQQELYRKAIETGEFPWLDSMKDEAIEALCASRKLIETAFERMEGDPTLTEHYRPAFEADLDFVDGLTGMLQEGLWDDAVAAAGEHAFRSFKPLRKYPDAGKKEEITALRDKGIKPILGDVKQLLSGCSSLENIGKDLREIFPVLCVLFDLVRRLTAVLDEEKRKRNILDFSDVELLTLRALAERNGEGYRKTALAVECEACYDEILVDEYQDINEVQDMIFRALSRDETNLFLVGDIKQSIYRFRKAMPELFLHRSEVSTPYDGEHFPALIRLDANFRSRQSVTDAVNFLFEALMSPALGEVSYRNESLKPLADYQPSEEDRTELHIIDLSMNDETAADKSIVCEARHIAYEIRRMIAQGMPVTERGGVMRRCRYGDFCILLRAFEGKAELFEQEFKRQGIPLWNDSSSGYFDSEEVSTVLSLLRVLDNPLQDVPLLSALLSPLYGFTPDEVAEIRLTLPSRPLYIALKATARTNEKARSFLESVDELRSFCAVNRLDGLIQYIYDTTGFIAFAGASPSGEQRTANLRLLLEYARQFEDAGYRGLSGFLRYIDRTIESGRDFKAANTVNEKANVVRLMTIHHAKGLEFPVCFVADLKKPFNRSDTYGDVFLHARKGIGLTVRRPETLQRYQTLPSNALRLAIWNDMLSEEMRVLYVALTRPKEKLILVYSVDDVVQKLKNIRRKALEYPPSSFALRRMSELGEWILSAMLPSEEMCDAVGFDPCPGVEKTRSGIDVRVFPPISAEEARELDFVDSSKVNEELLRLIQERLSFAYPHSEVAALPGKMTVTQLAKAEGAERVTLAKPAFLRSQKYTAAERGTILHRFLQQLDLRGMTSVEEEIRRQTEAGYLSEEQTKCISPEKIRRFLSSDLAKRMTAAGDRLCREYKFMYEMNAAELFDVPGADKETILIQGVADGVLAEPDGLVIIDYKTDRVEEEEALDERYRAQLDLYGKALERSFGLPVKEKVIYSFSLDKAITLSEEGA